MMIIHDPPLSIAPLLAGKQAHHWVTDDRCDQETVDYYAARVKRLKEHVTVEFIGALNVTLLQAINASAVCLSTGSKADILKEIAALKKADFEGDVIVTPHGTTAQAWMRSFEGLRVMSRVNGIALTQDVARLYPLGIGDCLTRIEGLQRRSALKFFVLDATILDCYSLTKCLPWLTACVTRDVIHASMGGTDLPKDLETAAYHVSRLSGEDYYNAPKPTGKTLKLLKANLRTVEGWTGG